MNTRIDPFVDCFTLKVLDHLFNTHIPDFYGILKDETVDVSVF